MIPEFFQRFQQKKWLVVDTDVFSFVQRGDSRSHPYRSCLLGRRLVISFATYTEILYGAFKNNWGERRITHMLEHIDHLYRVYPVDKAVCTIAAKLMAAPGQNMKPMDAFIAATALTLQCPLATHNKKDFTWIQGLEVF